jgi:hypothetical protein
MREQLTLSMCVNASDDTMMRCLAKDSHSGMTLSSFGSIISQGHSLPCSDAYYH